MVFYLIIFIVLILALLFYFKIADRFNIIDKPNERSSHQAITIRGGGVIFPLSMLFAGICHPAYLLPALAAMLIGIVSFMDDRISLSNKVRLLFHLIAVSLLFYYLDIYTSFPVWACVLLYILVIGIINAYNFMDGVNGITGLYSLVVLAALQYVNFYSHAFVQPDMIWLPMMACSVFLYFNFRKKARCFAGDVGSISMAFWVLLLLLKLMIVTGNPLYLLFLTVYGVDSVLTILHRLWRKENIFEAHRLHFFQLLANELGWQHRVVSLIYALLQAFLCFLIISLMPFVSPFLLIIIIVMPTLCLYLIFKPRLMKLRKAPLRQ